MSYIPEHLLWLDRTPSRFDGWPLFLTDESIEWLKERVDEYLYQTVTSGGQVTLDNARRHWMSSPDRPEDLQFSLQDALYGVTYRAMLALQWEQVWVSTFPKDYDLRNRRENHTTP